MASLAPPVELLRRRIAGEIVAFFNDSEQGQEPIKSSPDSLCPPHGVAWRVHGDVTSMMVGGIAALLLQMLHPGALAGVWDHSDFQKNMHGRLRNTARFIAVTTYGHRDQAEAAIARVRRIHDHVNGTLPDGTPYGANDPRLLAWVHVAGSAMFLNGWIRFGEPGMSAADKDAYWREVAPVARLLGADPVPETAAAAAELLRSFIPELKPDERTRTVRNIILRNAPDKLRILPVQALLMQSAVDLLPPWARRMHAVRSSGLTRPAVGAATLGLAGTLRWALSPR
ncbi:oxygenase MpaB family protein [uncultured Sphingomonas sp.]|uniref:oxygenase MpaB family protein n=1 Tax=uncultured Sphingomonas sp. TaxID=158754 RepID=UPI0025E9CD71|nr:oxygenase MpaB family protein [uncultured Sphingomonas sp.]